MTSIVSGQHSAQRRPGASANALVNDAIRSNPIAGKLESLGFTPKRRGLQECATQVREEWAKWARYVTLAKIDPQYKQEQGSQQESQRARKSFHQHRTGRHYARTHHRHPDP